MDSHICNSRAYFFISSFPPAYAWTQLLHLLDREQAAAELALPRVEDQAASKESVEHLPRQLVVLRKPSQEDLHRCDRPILPVDEVEDQLHPRTQGPGSFAGSQQVAGTDIGLTAEDECADFHLFPCRDRGRRGT
jgi:hypothetical protein